MSVNTTTAIEKLRTRYWRLVVLGKGLIYHQLVEHGVRQYASSPYSGYGEFLHLKARVLMCTSVACAEGDEGWVYGEVDGQVRALSAVGAQFRLPKRLPKIFQLYWISGEYMTRR